MFIIRHGYDIYWVGIINRNRLYFVYAYVQVTAIQNIVQYKIAISASYALAYIICTRPGSSTY